MVGRQVLSYLSATVYIHMRCDWPFCRDVPHRKLLLTRHRESFTDDTLELRMHSEVIY